MECLSNYADCNQNYLDGCEININTTLEHCGECGHKCDEGQICNGFGLCAESCATGSIFCGTACVKTSVNNIGEGGCKTTFDENNHPITYVDCVENYANCDNNPENGCEYFLVANHAQSCEDKQVICSENYGDCDGDYENGCEYSLIPNHATSCTREKPDDGVNVILTCAGDWADCNGDYTDGCEFQLSTHNATGCSTNDEGKIILECIQSGSASYADCDDDYENGCEYDLKSNYADECVYNAEYCDDSNHDCYNNTDDIYKRGLLTCTASYAGLPHLKMSLTLVKGFDSR